MSFIQTVLGTVAPEKLGPCYSHEHLIIDNSFATAANTDFLLNDLEAAYAELRACRGAGVRAMVDSMPCDCGRNVKKLALLAAETYIHIVAPTGLHLAKYYDPGHWSHFYETEQLVDLFVADIQEGIDQFDYSGPLLRRTAHKAGIIKVAALREWDARTKKIFAAAAEAHGQTGAPILTHTEEGCLALEQAHFLAERGVDLQHVVLSHLDRNPDLEYQRQVLSTGVTIEYDSHFRWKNRPDNPTIELLKNLLPEFPDQIVLGMDAARRSYWNIHGGSPGMPWLYAQFRPQLLEAGLSEELLNKVFVSTPARVYAFKS